MFIQDPKKIVISNDKGNKIEFGGHFRLLDGFNLSGLLANVVYSDSNSDGATYQRTTLQKRQLDLNFYIECGYNDPQWVEARRRELFTVLNPQYNPMRINFTTKGGKEYFIIVNLEGTPLMEQDFSNSNRRWQRVLAQFSSGDANVYSAVATQSEISTVIPLFEFVLEIPQGEGIEFGNRTKSLIANVVNKGDCSTGMIIHFRAMSNVTNPRLLNVYTQEELRINHFMTAGDVIQVNTNKGQKSAYLFRNGVATNIFNAIDLNSTWLQLAVGDNLFRYTSENELENEYLNISISFNEKFVGV